MAKEFEEMKKLYSKQIRDNADALDLCDSMDAMICALYGFSKLAITRFHFAKEYAEDKKQIYTICKQIDEQFKGL